jgi:hypothetical protein
MSDTVFILLFMLTLTLALFRGVRNLRMSSLWVLVHMLRTKKRQTRRPAEKGNKTSKGVRL